MIIAGICFVMLDGIQHVTNYFAGKGTLEQIGEGWLWTAGAFLAHAVWTKSPDPKERGELFLVGGIMALLFHKNIDEGWLWVAGAAAVYGLLTSGLLQRVDPPAFEGTPNADCPPPERDASVGRSLSGTDERFCKLRALEDRSTRSPGR